MELIPQRKSLEMAQMLEGRRSLPAISFLVLELISLLHCKSAVSQKLIWRYILRRPLGACDITIYQPTCVHIYVSSWKHIYIERYKVSPQSLNMSRDEADQITSKKADSRISQQDDRVAPIKSKHPASTLLPYPAVSWSFWNIPASEG